MKRFIIGNWKANKNLAEVEKWFKDFSNLYNREKLDRSNNLEMVICPPFVYLHKAYQLIMDYHLPLKLGAQNVAPYDNGAWTGEVTARQIKEYAGYVLIGHSERRQNFKEEDSILAQKVIQAKAFNLKIVYCIPDEKTFIPEGVDLVAYEPVWAIGTGKTETPENAGKISEEIKKKRNETKVIYGGSVKADNVLSFLSNSYIDGVLPGGSSLEAGSFWQMILHATAI